MRTAFLLLCLVLAGCGSKGANHLPDMKSVAAALRSMPSDFIPEDKFSLHGVAKADKSENETDQNGDVVLGRIWMRFPAADGYVWARIDDRDHATRVAHDTIQFSPSGKRQ